MTDLLLVEDDGQLRRILSQRLTRRGFHVIQAASVNEAKSKFSQTHIGLVILDLGLPDYDGSEFITWVRHTESTPVVVLSARRSQLDKVNALNAGADDFLTKPFGFEELVARIHATLRRSGAATSPLTFQSGGLVIDPQHLKCQREDIEIHFTPIEWKILELLLSAQGRLVSYEELVSRVWASSAKDRRAAIRVHIANIRTKLEEDAAHPQFVLAVPGLGYQFDQS